MKKLILGTMLAGALSLAPAVMTAQDHDHDQEHHDTGNKKYYDSAHKDHHEWNDNENTAWSSYREEHHIKQSDFSRASKRDQQAYWNWRHEHGDNH